MTSLHTPDQFNTRTSLMGMGFIGLVLAYLLLTRAFETGSWFQYFGTVGLLVVGIRLIFRGIKSKK